MYDSKTYEQEKNNELGLNGIIKILSHIESFENKWHASVNDITLTGGDPLLHRDWKDIIIELHNRGKNISFLGNPETLNEDSVRFIAGFSPSFFQLSLDGLEKTHDRFRYLGSFKTTLKKIELLSNFGIQTNIMFTLYPSNLDELIPLMQFVAKETTANSFSFDLGCFVGNATNIQNTFNPKKLYFTFKSFLDAADEIIKNEKLGLRVHEKSRFFSLLHFEKGSYSEEQLKWFLPSSGCSVGWGGVAILSDGTVLPCRRLPIALGKMPESNFEDIFLGSRLLRKFRRKSSFEECGDCIFFNCCRGCPAYVASITGDPFSKHPLCFRNLIEKNTLNETGRHYTQPLSGSYVSEYGLIASGKSLLYKQPWKALLVNSKARDLFIELSYLSDEQFFFMSKPDEYCMKNDILLSTKEKRLISDCLSLFDSELIHPHLSRETFRTLLVKQIEDLLF